MLLASLVVLGPPAQAAPVSAKDRPPPPPATEPTKPVLRGTLDDDILTGTVDPTGPLPARDAGVFNTVPIPIGQLAISARWQAILDADPSRVFRQGCDVSPATCRSLSVRAFKRLEAETASAALPRMVLLRKVNLAVNHSVRYQVDPVTWGVEDYWATPAETAARGAGDCEDYAIMKLGMLQALGQPLATMQVVVVKDLKRRIGHAVLAVKLGGSAYILDNLTDLVRSDAEIAEYQPYYSVSSVGNWLHGIRRATPTPAASGGLMTGDPAGQLRGTLGASTARP